MHHVLDESQLTDTDEEILQMLRDGRVTAPFVADETGKSREYIRARLRRLVEHEHATRVYDGLYELTNDPSSLEDNSDNQQ